MKKNYSGRINALKTRRQSETKRRGLEKSSAAGYMALDSAIEPSLLIEENYQKRTSSSALTYAFGAMDEVDSKYTEISISESSRIISQLKSGLSSRNIPTEFRLQGSLPLNVHIRRASDVDILTLATDFFIYDSSGILGNSYTPSDRNRTDVILKIRNNCVSILDSAFYTADVDDSKAKCITVTGGSLKRDVDVVPALWYNSAQYQNTNTEKDRGVFVYDKNNKEFLDNYPFLVQNKINQKDQESYGGCKKAIRLLKNLKNDADNEIEFSSYDIMSVVYSMSSNDLYVPRFFDGLLLIRLRDHLRYLSTNTAHFKTLKTVDQTRNIIQKDSDILSFNRLLQELQDLIDSIEDEILGNNSYNLKTIEEALTQAYPTQAIFG